MRFWIVNDRTVTFDYSDDGDTEVCDQCLSEDIDGWCNRKRFAHRVTKGVDTFVFCHDSNSTKKNAKYLSKITASSFKKVYKAVKKKRSDHTEIEQIAYHNAKKMNASIGQKINKIISDDELSQSRSKVNLIEQKIKKHSSALAKEILSVRKIVEQIETEYNLIEILDVDQPFRKEDLTKIKIHQLVVSAFYIYEEDFKNKRIKVNLNLNEEVLLVDYGVAKSAVGQIFANAIKYCKKNTELTVHSIVNGDYIEIIFTMISLFFTEHESEIIVRRAVRGQNSVGIPGSGIGLFAVQNYMRLHSGYLMIAPEEKTKHASSGNYYATNSFVLAFPRII